LILILTEENTCKSMDALHWQSCPPEAFSVLGTGSYLDKDIGVTGLMQPGFDKRLYQTGAARL
jgi:hypothetical protein